MKNTKKVIAIMLAIVTIFSAVSISASAFVSNPSVGSRNIFPLVTPEQTESGIWTGIVAGFNIARQNLPVLGLAVYALSKLVGGVVGLVGGVAGVYVDGNAFFSGIKGFGEGGLKLFDVITNLLKWIPVPK